MYRLKKNHASLLLFCGILPLLFLLSACNRNVIFSDNQHVDEDGWNMNEQLYFNVKIEDTTQFYDFCIDVRNANTFAYSNLFLFINTTFPDGSIAADTLECPLADLEGKWYGKSSGHYIDGRYFLRRNVRFPMCGDYRFQVFHGMRDTNLVGISDISFIISKHEKGENNQ
ncbi:MAG: gliding motility lipoprotein GldH [Bacteroidales bacterium]|nr:gliding motility lipoprotein GldH [Bacteroidales bacterium]